MKFERKNFAMHSLSTHNVKGDTVNNSEGIVQSHCYSLLDVHEVTDEDGGDVRLMKLRNPWGHKEWTGDWSDSSDMWTDELKEQLKFE